MKLSEHSGMLVVSLVLSQAMTEEPKAKALLALEFFRS